jgi:hypothetical protein
MQWITVALVAWVVLSFALAPVLGLFIRGADAFERARSPQALRAMAQHPANRAA